jgi:hypothetical protein
LYDSLNDILAIKKEATQLSKALGVKHPLTEHEFNYIQEHVECTRPVANLIDILQGEKDIFYGIFLPSLFALKRKLHMLSKRDWVHCGPLVASLKESVCERFSQFFTFTTAQSVDAAIAALAYPRFQRWWLQCVDEIDHATLLAAFTNAVHTEQRFWRDEMVNMDTMNVDNDEYFDFGQSSGSRTSPTSTSHSELLIHQYFADPARETSSLSRYPAIQAVFFRYNTPLPSSAPVERLFSYATMINLPKCNALSDEMFERRVVLKANMGQILF